MIALALLASIYSANCIAFVYDGETVERCDRQRLRLVDIDAPAFEDAPACASPATRDESWCDTDAARRASQALETFLQKGSPTIWYTGQKDRLGQFLVSIDVNGMDAGQYLISLGLVRAIPGPEGSSVP